MREKARVKGWRRTGFALALLAVSHMYAHVGVCTSSSSSFSYVDQELWASQFLCLRYRVQVPTEDVPRDLMRSHPQWHCPLHPQYPAWVYFLYTKPI